eukprot:CAMPEP_0184866234 /NCGR_PEP_ID=MMETSP0580-20130426/21475_1 /TAXON_ID=1118495 /ORGANISM="Dactyliosolen fragilissimus" /LENGTH=692 /DNA_ID=CAMNT_0027365801 /DNA_START=174 /DNA_END=2252 /DNA_ORIENTATION=-
MSFIWIKSLLLLLSTIYHGSVDVFAYADYNTHSLTSSSRTTASTIQSNINSISKNGKYFQKSSILGRAVLTTPHRRVQAIRIARSTSSSKTLPPNEQTNNSTSSQSDWKATPIYVTKSELSERLQCPLRDLRLIDPLTATSSSSVKTSSGSSSSSGSNNNISPPSSSSVASTSSLYAGPAFLARSHCVIVHVGHVRAIVMRDEVLLFPPEDKNTPFGVKDGKEIEKDDNDENMGYPLSIMSIGQVIEALVEALVEHLNSIYTRGPSLMDTANAKEFSSSSMETEGLLESTKREIHNSTTKPIHKWRRWFGKNNNHPSSSLNIPNNTNQNNSTVDNTTTQFDNKDTTIECTTGMESTHPSFSSPPPPFELVVIEALLGHVCSQESIKVTKLLKSANRLLDAITFGGGGSTSSTDESKSTPDNTMAPTLIINIWNQLRRRHKTDDAFLGMQAKLGELLPLKNRVDNLEAQCAEIANAIAEVLKNDDDMAAMRLSALPNYNLASIDTKKIGNKNTSTSTNLHHRKESPPDKDSNTRVRDRVLNEKGSLSDTAVTANNINNQSNGFSRDHQNSQIYVDPYNLHSEVELLFEDYLLQMDELLYSLRSVQSSVRNTEEVVEIELDLIRNRIMRYEMLLELSGLVVGVAAAVTGAFGMNLVNRFEEHPTMFYQVSGGLILFMIAMGYGILKKLEIDSIY